MEATCLHGNRNFYMGILEGVKESYGHEEMVFIRYEL
jgi:hypothetical protein